VFALPVEENKQGRTGFIAWADAYLKSHEGRTLSVSRHRRVRGALRGFSPRLNATVRVAGCAMVLA